MAWYRVTHRASGSTPAAFRFVLFLVKMSLLGRACWPNSFNITVGAGLIMAAAVDLSWTLETWMTVLLCLLHLLFVFMLRSRAQLCHAGPDTWEWNSGFHIDGARDS